LLGVALRLSRWSRVLAPDRPFSWWAFRPSWLGGVCSGLVPPGISLTASADRSLRPFPWHRPGLTGAAGHLASCFYLAFPAGARACTDAAMALHRGDAVLGPFASSTPRSPCACLLAEAARQVLHPFALLVVGGARRRAHGPGRRLAAEGLRRPGAAAALVMTPGLDGTCFLMRPCSAPSSVG